MVILKTILAIMVFMVIVVTAYGYVFGCEGFAIWQNCGLNEDKALFVLIIAGFVMVWLK